MKKNILKGASLVLLASVALVACKKESDFTVVNSTAWVGEPVLVKDNNEKIKNSTYFYDFGDGSSVNGISSDVKAVGNVNPSHTYNRAGVYTITQQISKSNNKGGKTITGSQTVTIQMVTPKMELSVAAPSTNQRVWIKNTTDESTNKGTSASYNVIIEGPAGTTVTSTAYDTRSFEWTPQSSGTYKITMYAYQGSSKSMVTADVTVTGFNSAATAEMLNGTWNVAVSASLTGAAYSVACQGASAGTLVSNYSSISLNNDGNIYAAVRAFPTAQAGNVETPGSDIDVIDAGHVSVNLSMFSNSTPTLADAVSSATGVYKIKSASATSIVLERVQKGEVCFPAAAYNDVFTITLTK